LCDFNQPSNDLTSLLSRSRPSDLRLSVFVLALAIACHHHHLSLSTIAIVHCHHLILSTPQTLALAIAFHYRRLSLSAIASPCQHFKGLASIYTNTTTSSLLPFSSSCAFSLARDCSLLSPSSNSLAQSPQLSSLNTVYSQKYQKPNLLYQPLTLAQNGS